MFCNGTVMLRRKFMPAADITLKKSNTDRGFYKYCCTVAGDIIACTWRDRNIVAFVSSAFPPSRSSTERTAGKILLCAQPLCSCPCLTEEFDLPLCMVHVPQERSMDTAAFLWFARALRTCTFYLWGVLMCSTSCGFLQTTPWSCR